MSGKGSKRRRENTALVEANWERVFGKREPTASPVLHAQVAEEEGGAAIQGAAVLDVQSGWQGDGGNGR